MSEQSARHQRKTKAGVVVSNRMMKTIIVRVTRMTKHPKYGRVIEQTNTFKAHDETNRAAIGARIRANLRTGDIACRTGGDEFVALLRSSRSADGVERLAARVRLLLAGPYLIDGVPVPASVSVGWSWDKPVSPEKLLHIADERMYSSKRR